MLLPSSAACSLPACLLLLTGLLVSRNPLHRSSSANTTLTIGWGKRDYPCINAWSGPTGLNPISLGLFLTNSVLENSTIPAGTEVTIQFNLESGRCNNLYEGQSPNNWSLWLYNNPVHDMGFADWDKQVPINKNISAEARSVTFSIPTDLPPVDDDSLWYLRLSASLPRAPQVCIPAVLATSELTWPVPYCLQCSRSNQDCLGRQSTCSRLVFMLFTPLDSEIYELNRISAA